MEGEMEFKVPEINKPKESEIDDLLTRVKIARAKIDSGDKWEPKKLEIKGLEELGQIEQVVAPVVIRAEVERRKREKKVGADDALVRKYKTVVEKATEGETAWLDAGFVNREADSYIGREDGDGEDEKKMEERVLKEARGVAGEVMAVVAAMSVEEIDKVSLVVQLLSLRKRLELFAVGLKKTWQELAREAGVSNAGVGAMEAVDITKFDLFGDVGKQPVAMAA